MNKTSAYSTYLPYLTRKLSSKKHPTLSRYLEWNSNKTNTLVLIHGYADDASMFAPFEEMLPDIRLISINLPMNFEHKTFNMEGLNTYINEIVEELGLESYSIAGFSLGGIIALEHSYHNDKIKNLIMLNSYPEIVKNGFMTNMIPTEKIKDPIYGTLFNCIGYEGMQKYRDLKINKKIIMFKDDKLMPPRKGEFQVDLAEIGGHATKAIYFITVAEYLKEIV